MRNQEGMRLTYGLTGMGLRTGHAADSSTDKLRANDRHYGATRYRLVTDRIIATMRSYSP